MASDNSKDAQKRLENALSVSPDDVLALLKMAELRIRNGLVYEIQGAETRQILRQVISLAPESINAFSSLAYFYSTGEISKEALQCFKKPSSCTARIHTRGSNMPCGCPNYLIASDEPEAVCPIRLFSTDDASSEMSLLGQLTLAERNESICNAINEAKNCAPRRWSVYATDGVSPLKPQ